MDGLLLLLQHQILLVHVSTYQSGLSGFRSGQVEQVLEQIERADGLWVRTGNIIMFVK